MEVITWSYSVLNWVCQRLLTGLTQHVTMLLVLCLIFLILKLRWSYVSARKQIPKSKRVLFVTAHPDDEVMFFGPVLINMIKRAKNHVYILCLSSGNHKAKGSERKTELWRCCKRLGISESNITMLKFDELQDGPDNEWSVELLCRVIDNHVKSHSIQGVITFDDAGVSGHRNHIACFHAVNKLLSLPSANVRVFLLDSVSLFRKYLLHFFDFFVSYHASEYLYVVNWTQRCEIVAGMKCHESQLTWYRRLYLLFSRYIFINSLTELKGLPKETKKIM